MVFKYDSIVPWGRSFEEYRRMFALGDEELGLRIVGCADGPASFNLEMKRRGNPVVSCDPLYGFSADQIKKRIDSTFNEVIEKTTKNRHKFIWDEIKSVDELGRIRMQSMLKFLDDFEQGKKQGRYLNAALPSLPLAACSFELALCSHFLFLYSDNLSFDFHLSAVLEMCRVAPESRIFPVLDYNSRRSRHLDPLIEVLAGKGFNASIEKVPYEFQKGGNEMLRLQASGR